MQLIDVNTNLIVGGSASTLSAQNATINNAADLEMNGGVLGVGGVPAAGFGVLDVNAGGELLGHGTVNLTEALLGSETLLVNDGAISASRAPLVAFGEPQIGTLSINSTDTDARIDLDGTGENGVLNVFRNQTLDINVAPNETFDGDINLFHNSTLDWAFNWTLASGTIDVNNGFVDNTFPTPDVPADTSFISGGTLTQTGGTISVVDTDGTLQFDAQFTMTGGTFVNEGHTIFNENATINNPAVFTMGIVGSDLTVGENAQVTINQTIFNLDGGGAGTVITVNSNALLSLNLGDYDDFAVVNRFNGTMILHSGDVEVFTADAEFIMDGTISFSNTTSSVPVWDGEPLDIGDDTDVLDANVNVSGTGISQFGSQVDFNSDADVNVAAGATLQFVTVATVNFNTVNGANNAEFTGAGAIEFSGIVNVNEAVTLNMVGGTVDLDGSDSTGEIINIDAPMTINAATMRSFGRVNVSGGINTLDVNNNAGTGVLTVNLDDPSGEWTLNFQGVMNLVNDNVAATLLAGSDLNVNGTVNVTGDVRTTARLDIGSTGVVNINTAGQPLRLAGGGNFIDPNTLNGGAINGAGILAADTGKGLVGFGTINTDIDFDGSANLRADNGMLTINGTIIDVETLGTADADGILNIPAAWMTTGGPGGNITFVTLAGGTLQGGTITNTNGNGIIGFGTVTSRLINNAKVAADIGDGTTLIFQTAANDNDWDGAVNTGDLIASFGATLELRDNALFGFTGSVTAFNNGTVFTNGFALDFNPGSDINLTAGKYQSTNTTDIGGTVTVNVGADSTIEVQVDRFLDFEATSVTTLNANLRLVSNNASIAAGATFSGTGALIVPDNSHLVADANANINVLLDNQGAFRPAGLDTVGRVDLKDYQQAATGELFIELAGTGLNQFDRVVINGAALLAGSLDVDLEGGFVPALGNTFAFLTTTAGVSGTFSGYSLPSIGAVNSLAVAYGANNVTLLVIAGLWGDYNQNGVVDTADYAVWRKTLGTGVAAFSGADGSGNGLVDQADYDLWKSRFGIVLGPGAGSGAAVPEPASIILLLGSLLIPAPRRQNWRRNPVSSGAFRLE